MTVVVVMRVPLEHIKRERGETEEKIFSSRACEVAARAW
jgi:hypothetical protein